MKDNADLFSLLLGDHCGCGAKLGPWDLADLLGTIKENSLNHEMSSIKDWDDVGAMEWNQKVIVQNIDLISPVSDDPYKFGQISAANSLSDIYAKGAIPLFAMNLLGYPFAKAPLAWAKDILRGGQDFLYADSVPLLGGHTIDDYEPKFGLAVVGYTEKGMFIKNSSVKVGDCLLLTKPIGSGTIITGKKNMSNFVKDDDFRFCLDVMATSNKNASLIMRDVMISACTDVTGFGLAGHLAEMILPGGFVAEIYFDKIPVMPGAFDLIDLNIFSPALHRNQDYLQLLINIVQYLSPQRKEHSILFDPQTSGGLIMSVPYENLKLLQVRLQEAGIASHVIGTIIDKQASAKLIIQ